MIKKAKLILIPCLAIVGLLTLSTLPAYADSTPHCTSTVPSVSSANTNLRCCGGGADQNPYLPSFDIGCQGKGNPIMDLTFAIIRWLSDGVGFVIVASLIVGGIQIMTSQGDSQAMTKAMTRIQSTVIALLIFVFGYAILNYLIPDGLLH